MVKLAYLAIILLVQSVSSISINADVTPTGNVTQSLINNAIKNIQANMNGEATESDLATSGFKTTVTKEIKAARVDIKKLPEVLKK